MHTQNNGIKYGKNLLHMQSISSMQCQESQFVPTQLLREWYYSYTIFFQLHIASKIFPYEIKYNKYASLPCDLAFNIYKAITILVLVILRVRFNFIVGQSWSINQNPLSLTIPFRSLTMASKLKDEKCVSLFSYFKFKKKDKFT